MVLTRLPQAGFFFAIGAGPPHDGHCVRKLAMIRAMRSTPTLRQPCPPGTCTCRRDDLLATPGADLRILRLTQHEEKRLLQRLESIASLAELEHLRRRMDEQLGIRLSIEPGASEVRSMRGIAIEFAEQPGLCRKTRRNLPIAIRRALERHPEIAWRLLDAHDLLRDA